MDLGKLDLSMVVNSVLGSSLFSMLPQLLPKLLLDSKFVTYPVEKKYFLRPEKKYTFSLKINNFLPKHANLTK